jgi:bifunctional DNase/RNase
VSDMASDEESDPETDAPTIAAVDAPTLPETAAESADHEVEPSAAIDPPAWFIPVEFIDVELTLPSTHPLVILEEIDPPHRQLRIPIGIAEGSAIAYAARKIATPRPLTHEFATSILESLDVVLETVRITESVGNAYSAEAVFSSPLGLRTIPCRPSDGVCLALRQRSLPPIAVAAVVLEEMGYDRNLLPG